jgi:transposase
MKATHASREVSDAFWERVEPLIPQRPIRLSKRKYARKPGAGRKPKAPREVFEMEGIAWRWQSFDGALLKAPPARQSVGPNPNDQRKKWKQANAVGRRPWGPAIDRRDRG